LNDERAGISFRPATRADAEKVATCVNQAYQHYVARIGKPPGPMLEDYAQVIRQHQVFIAELDGTFVGVLVLALTDEGFLLDNVAVDPHRHGQGIGRALLEFAESQARRAGYKSIYLYTHEKMTENRALYTKIGYVEYDRRTEKGYSRVYMRKQLA
jgi:GNAT superfamily N-acetyltransferase